MARYNAPFEIHVHGEVVLRPEVTQTQIEDALKPLWKYAGARSLSDAAGSFYEDEPGIAVDAREHKLQMCWTVEGDEDIRPVLDEMCMNINELARTGAAIEVSFYDIEFDDEDESQPDDAQAQDDFYVLFVGPDPASILQVQRDLLVRDVISVMERHFDGAELGGVVEAIDRLYAGRYDALASTMQLGRLPSGFGGNSGRQTGGRKPRHLH